PIRIPEWPAAMPTRDASESGTLNGTPKLTKFRISKFSVQAITRISVDKLILKQQIGLCRSYHRTAMMAGF
ncbi:hypothetical protein ACTXJX_19060, partial [Glutamicibacter ardleyensis]|uniref:hypothetical protein n=1 Tax=Glutamicibacter ardleyensis TaxID=225894 RepID=UPI003FD0B208